VPNHDVIKKELELRLVFKDRRPMDVVISFDDVEKIALFFRKMALSVRAPEGE
jgi:F0F1-type ATP synthase alpha subunit